MPPTILIRLTVACVWLYEGLWCKVLTRMPHQEDIAHSVPFLGNRFSHAILPGIGIVEILLGIWVLTGYQPWVAVWTQTILLVVMNTIGVLTARRFILDPAGMLFKNFAFLVLAWVAAAQTLH